jgi:hypothetical protein
MKSRDCLQFCWSTLDKNIYKAGPFSCESQKSSNGSFYLFNGLVYNELLMPAENNFADVKIFIKLFGFIAFVVLLSPFKKLYGLVQFRAYRCRCSNTLSIVLIDRKKTP